MMKRRDFVNITAGGLATAAGLGAAAALTADSAMAQASSPPPGKLFEYVICAELFWPDLPFPERLARIADSGFRRFEFWRFRDKDIDAMAKLCRQHALIPQDFVASFRINSAERRAEFLADLAEAVIVADKLGVVGPANTVLSDEEAGVTLMVEAVNVLVDHPGQLVYTVQQAADIVEAVGSPHVRLLFDAYHTQIMEGNLSGNIEKFKHLTVYHQVADHPGRHEPGTGEIT